MFTRLTCYHSRSPRSHEAIRGRYHCNMSPVTDYQVVIILLSTVINILVYFCVSYGRGSSCDAANAVTTVINIHPATAESSRTELPTTRQAGPPTISSLAQAVGERGNVGNNGGFRLLPAATSFRATADFAEFSTRLATDH
jgi:hypothetical protein